MFIKNLKDCEEFAAGDGCLPRELLHAAKGDFDFGYYSLAHAVVHPQEVTRPHRLKTTEVYYILEGKGFMHINEEVSEVTPGCTVYIPPNARQHIENPGDKPLKFLCIVDPAWRVEDEKIEKE